MDVRYVLGAVVVAFGLCGLAFTVQPAGGAAVSPVSFDETLSMGMTGVDVRDAEAAGYEIPRGQAFYAQYQYVIGYYGVEAMVEQLESGHAVRQFGEPVALFVTEFSGAQPSLTDDGYLDLDNDPGVDWVRADHAVYAVDSDARTTAGPTVVPFERRADAERFTDEYGGRVVDWDAVRERYGERPAVARERQASLVENRTAWADRRVAASASLLDRPRSVVVGRDAPTVQAAVERAPPNTTVYVPPGTYEENVTITKPLTLRGAGERTVVDGGGNGTVIRANASGVALADLTVRGVGPRDLGTGEGNVSGWDAKIQLVYGRGDAGILLSGANRSLVSNVTVDTGANGVIARYSDGTVVDGLVVNGTDQWQDGSMGVLTMYSRAVVQESTFEGGRDGVYTHRSDDLVVRNNEMRGMRYGVHEMYTSGALVRNNTFSDADAGVIVMSRPRENVILNNDVRDSDVGVSLAGDASYVTGNVLVGGGTGMTIAGTRSMYANNTVVDNDIGLRSDTILPSNRVVENDVAGNDAPATASSGPVAVWTSGGRGNYWAGAPGLDRDGDGVLDRPYRPADEVDRALAESPAGPTVARSPALGLLREAQAVAPGLRRSDVIDTGPLVEPSRPDVLTEVNAT